MLRISAIKKFNTHQKLFLLLGLLIASAIFTLLLIQKYSINKELFHKEIENQTNIYSSEDNSISFTYNNKKLIVSEETSQGIESLKIILLPNKDNLYKTLSDVTVTKYTQRSDDHIPTQDYLDQYSTILYVDQVKIFRLKESITYDSGTSIWYRYIFQKNDTLYQIQANFANPPDVNEVNEVEQIVSSVKIFSPQQTQ